MKSTLTALIVASVLLTQTQTPVAPAATVDKVFARWTAATPGCAVGVSIDGKSIVERAFGMADLERDVRNAPDTIFEAGSVSKQFTAAAVLLLAKEGKLSIDDPVRKYVPELPAYALDPADKGSGEAAPPKAPGAGGAADYGVPLTIRHMLTHTSGLRDWGEVAGIAGWPRGKRAHTHAHVLDIVSRQKALNFTPGTAWSYSNTGYNLAAIIVSRVSGQPFAEFTRDKIFMPLGMTRTSWRDDYTRVVKHRALAYDRAADGYHEDMPFENVHGNGGLLTTVGDLLRWNENFVTPKVGDAAFVAEEQTAGQFSDGRPHDYAFGLYVRPYRGVREVSHSGSTAGYRAFLTRYPDQHLSVAVLCNAGDANPTQYAHAVAESFLGDSLGAPPAAAASGTGRGSGQPGGFRPAASDLAAYVGRYTSDEAETAFTIAIDGEDLVLKRRPDTVLRMRPVEKDTFAVPTLGTITFRRSEGRVTELSVKLDRVWDLRFQRER
jgi:CubicO group peptidase (beta-lactamase class C family)